MKRFLRTIAPALKVFVLATLFSLSIYNQFVDTAQAYDYGSSDYCDMYPEDPQCGYDPCDSEYPPEECYTFCELNPDHEDCQEDPCFSEFPPSTCECDGAYGPPPPYCTDECLQAEPPPSCHDPCEGSNPPEECTDPCAVENPPSECINYYCNDGSYCSSDFPDDPVPCNYDPTGDGVDEPKEGDPSMCDCSCKTRQKYCGDATYCDGEAPTNYDTSHAGDPAWEEDSSICECEPLFYCDDEFYCEGRPACNYDISKEGVIPWEPSSNVCECTGYCPDEDNENYVDPASLACPQADSSLCSVGEAGCTDSTAENYDADAVIDDGSCEYLKTSTCSYEVTFEVNKINTLTGRIRNYSVGALQVVVVSYLDTDPDAPEPDCPVFNKEAFTAASYAFIYDLLFPGWPAFSHGAVMYSNMGESEDFCANLIGVQSEVPAGYVQSGINCIPDDMCTQDGCQIEDGICTCTDMCPNIAGNQTSIPAGYFIDGAGDCVTGEECTEDGCSLVDGVCRCPVNGNCATYAPDPSGPEPTGNLCTAGNPSEITESSSAWNYMCLGLWGGTNESCSIDMMCPSQKYCATNSISTQCIDNDMCCDGFVMCPNGQCRPGTLANCVDSSLECDTTVMPPLCARDGDVIQELRMTPPVSDIDTNSCVLSWTIDVAGGSVSCALTRDGSAVQSYGATTANQAYSRTVEPGKYEVACERLSTEIVTDAEGVESTYVLKVEDEQSMSCVQNPNYVEF